MFAGAWNGICEAWGHEDCSGQDDTEAIGNAFKGSKGSHGGRGTSSNTGGQWRVDFCASDSDGDGMWLCTPRAAAGVRLGHVDSFGRLVPLRHQVLSLDCSPLHAGLTNGDELGDVRNQCRAYAGVPSAPAATANNSPPRCSPFSLRSSHSRSCVCHLPLLPAPAQCCAALLDHRSSPRILHSFPSVFALAFLPFAAMLPLAGLRQRHA